jgi:hypothetical protein
MKLFDEEAALSTLREFGYKDTISNPSYQKAAVVIKDFIIGVVVFSNGSQYLILNSFFVMVIMSKYNEVLQQIIGCSIKKLDRNSSMHI